MKILWPKLLLLTCGAACVSAWLGDTAMTVVLCTAYFVTYDQMWRDRDG